jgi:glyoxylase-like metal-dependent hydrolase (beta-lactamase superfamily II)
MKLFSVITESWRMDGGVAFGVVPKSIWSKQYPSDEANLVPMVNRLLLVKTTDSLVLIDTGFGAKRDEKYYGYKYIFERTPLLDAIRGAGFSPDEVTDVIFTHLHDDHVGGAVEKALDGCLLVFPNAMHWVSAKQYEWATHPNPREAASFFPDNLQPIIDADKLRLVHLEGMLIPGIDVRMFDGHTGGQMIPFIHTPTGVVVFMGDVIPSKAHIPVPYLASVDIQPLIALQEKSDFLKEALENDYILYFEHDILHEACRLLKGEKGIVAGESLQVKDLFFSS